MRRKWTEAENQLIRLHYPDNLAANIVKFFESRTALQIQGHASVIGVKKSAEFFKSPESGRISKNNDIGVATRFYKQMPGWNKGKKQTDYMSDEMIANIKKTQFKAGQDPHNTVEIGSERLSKDGYIEIKVRHTKGKGGNNDNFEFKHRVVYEANFGPIPKDMIVVFKDCDPLNFEPSNLCLMTRKESLLMNTMCDTSIVKRFFGIKEPDLVAKIVAEMPEVIELKRSVIKLNQKINKEYAK